MNQKIQQLKTQCIVREQRGTSAFDSYMVDRFDTEKFAELIVKECVNMIENEAAQYAEPVWAFELVNDIKEHFGVEE